jgi:hypothetical protein
VLGRKGERRRATPRVPDEMEPSEAVSISLAQDPRDLDAKAVVGRRQFPGVHLEVLRDRIHAFPEDLQQRSVGRSCRQHSARQEDDRTPSLHSLTLSLRAERAERLRFVSVRNLTRSANAWPTTASSLTSHDSCRNGCSITWFTLTSVGGSVPATGGLGRSLASWKPDGDSGHVHVSAIFES